MSISLAIFDSRPYDREWFDALQQEYDVEPRHFQVRLGADTAALAENFKAVCAFVNDRIDRATVDKLVEGGTRLLTLRCAGYNNVDLKAAYGNLHVARVPAYSPYAVAEHAFALILALNRKTHRAYFRVRDANFAISGLTGFDLHGKTVGLIGSGKIGSVFIDIARGFGMKVLVYDPYADKSIEDEKGCRLVKLDELYESSDIISLHCPLTSETHHMINAESIAKMKDGVMLINTGRGKLIDTKDLIDALKERKIGSAGLDVYEEESEVFFEDFSDSFIDDDVLSRLLSFPNVLVTSHQGFLTREALESIARTTYQNVRDFFDQDEIPNEVCYRCDKGCPKKEKGRCF